jgi:uncharacterized phage protein (TIGR01671 family)
MKREIKFRAWDNKHRKMLDWHCITQSVFNNGNTHLMYDVFTNPSFVGDCGFIPMQFTGLHDKNGTEIYEGDIVKWIHQYGDFAPTIQTSIVEYKQYADGWIGYEVFNQSEVIGNIYENPELLN